MQGDTPIHRKTFLEMNEVEQTEFISALRNRRLQPINTYNEIKKALYEKKQTKIKEKLDKELVMFDRCLSRVEKYLNELQDRSNKLRALKIQLDIE